MSKTQVKEFLYKFKWGYPDDNSPPVNADEFTQWLVALINKAPAEYRKSVEITIDSRLDYDSSEKVIEVYYYRPETDNEYKERQAYLQFLKQKEITQAKALLARYGVGNE